MLIALAIPLCGEEKGELDAGPELSLSPALADMRVNGDSKGTIELFVDEQGEPYIPAKTLAGALYGLVKPEILDEVAPDGGLVSSTDLAPEGIGMSFDLGTLLVTITVEARAMVPIDLTSNRSVQSQKGEASLKPEAISASLGLSLELDPSLESETSGKAFSFEADLELEPLVKVFDLAALADADIGYASGFSCTLNDAGLIYDLPPLEGRIKAGIVDTKPAAFQTSTELLGLSFYRETSLEKIRHQLVLDNLVLERSAKVSIIMNGTVIRQLRLDPGTYRISDLPFATGLNDVSISIEEENAAPRVIHVGIPFDSEVLDKGEMDYALTAGVAKDKPALPLAEGAISMGLAKGLELGANAEAGFGGLLGGLSARWASPIGNIGFSAGVEAPYDGERAFNPSFAVQLSWRFAMASEMAMPRLGLALRYAGPGFTTLLEDNSSETILDIPSWQLSCQLSEALFRGKGNLAVYCDAVLRDQELFSLATSIGISLPLQTFASLSLSCGADWSTDDGLSPQASMTISVIPPDNRILQYSHDFIGPDDSIDLTESLNASNTSSVSLHGEGLAGGNDDTVLSLSYQSKQKLYAIGASGAYNRNLEYATTDLKGSISLSTAFAWAGGYWAETNAPSDALAILVPATSLSAYRVELMPQNGGSIATEEGRPAIVSGIIPYREYYAAVEMPDSPPDITAEPKSVNFFPTYGSITVIRAKAAASIAVHGRLIDSKGKPKADLPGDMLDEKGNKKAFGGTFTDDDGIFECYDLDIGEYKILWIDGSTSSFTIADDETRKLVDIGDIQAELPASGGGSGQ